MKTDHPAIVGFVQMVLGRRNREMVGESLPLPPFTDEDLERCKQLVDLTGVEVVDVRREPLYRDTSLGGSKVLRADVVYVENPMTGTQFLCCVHTPKDFVTKWFEQLVQRVLSDTERGLGINGWSEEDAFVRACEFVRDEVEEARPLDPIQFTHMGDAMCEVWPTPHGENFFVRHTRDKDELRGVALGMHAICGGMMGWGPTTRTHDAIWCKECYLRVTFPRSFDRICTYGELRAHFQGVLHL